MKTSSLFTLGGLLLLGATAGAAQSPTPVNALLVLEKQQGTLAIIDPESLAVVARIPVGNEPHEAAVSDDGKTAYASNYRAATIAVVDLVAQKALPSIDLGALRSPHGLYFAGGKLYFTAEGAKVVGRYDPEIQKVDWVVGTGQDRTHMVVVSKDLTRVFTSNVSSATVSAVELKPARDRGGPPPQGGSPGQPGRGAQSAPPPAAGAPGGSPDWSVVNIAVGDGAEGLDLSPDGKHIWVANARAGTISVIDVSTGKVLQTLRSTGNANRLKITPDGRYVFVSDLDSNEMLVIDTATRKEYRRIKLPGYSEGIQIAPDGSRVYATLNRENVVAVIDVKSMSAIGEVKTGQSPDGMAWAMRK